MKRAAHIHVLLALAVVLTPLCVEAQSVDSVRTRFSIELAVLLDVKAMAERVANPASGVAGRLSSARPMTIAMSEFQRKYAVADTIVAAATRVYATSFTAPELERLIAFYRSDIGQKLVHVVPVADSIVSSAVTGIFNAHRAELQQLLLQAAGSSDPKLK